MTIRKQESRLLVLEKLAKACAILAGVLLTVITLMTCVSLIGRNTTGWTMVGDFELSGRRRRRGHRAVPALVPAAARQHHRRLLHRQAPATDQAPARPLRRPAAGAGDGAAGLAHRDRRPQRLVTQSGTMMLGFPEWIVYAAWCRRWC